MCGIAGFVAASPMDGEAMARQIRAMTDTLRHRGPDGHGEAVFPDEGTALGHTRLAIIDLSEQGTQPMASKDGRYVLTYNGEIYNYRELRAELEETGARFTGHSDTEVLVEAIARRGVRETVNRCVGMFAFALWDRRERELTLVRDRAGIKPLYYGTLDGQFLFASELKAMVVCTKSRPTLNRSIIPHYLATGYIPSPDTIYEGVSKLPPGSILVLRDGKTSLSQFWNADDVWLHGTQHPFEGTEEEAMDELERIVGEAVGCRLVADVPLGAFLSGGIDSSLVAAFMQQRSPSPVRTFTIGFREQAYNEADHAREVAAHLKTEHTELCCTPQTLLDTVPSLSKHWDEPFADSSQIPTLLLCRLTRPHVTVALSGDGGDELFAGYQRYSWASNWRKLDKIPLALRRMLHRTASTIPRSVYGLMGHRGGKIHSRLDLLAAGNYADFYRRLISMHPDTAAFVPGTQPCVLPGLDERHDLYQAATLWDFKHYLPDDILTKVDRASMAWSLEARVPLLDHRVAQFAATLPTAWKVSGTGGKTILKKLLYRHVPRKLVDRPKKGFGVPVEHWLGNELKEWAADLLSPENVRGHGLLDPGKVQDLWNRYLKGENEWHALLWAMLMLQDWLDSAGP